MPRTSTATEAWVDVIREMTRDEFVASHPGFFLMSSEEAQTLASSFETDVVDYSQPKPRSGVRNLEIRWIRKSADNPFSDRVSVGRANNCDISLRHPSVSKLHAHFRVLQEGRRLTVTDLRSRNGTRVNDNLLASEVAEPVAVHDKVQFGSVYAIVLNAAAVYDFLASTL